MLGRRAWCPKRGFGADAGAVLSTSVRGLRRRFRPSRLPGKKERKERTRKGNKREKRSRKATVCPANAKGIKEMRLGRRTAGERPRGAVPPPWERREPAQRAARRPGCRRVRLPAACSACAARRPAGWEIPPILAAAPPQQPLRARRQRACIFRAAETVVEKTTSVPRSQNRTRRQRLGYKGTIVSVSLAGKGGCNRLMPSKLQTRRGKRLSGFRGKYGIWAVSIVIWSQLPALGLQGGLMTSAGTDRLSLITKYTLRSARCQHSYKVLGTKESTEKQSGGERGAPRMRNRGKRVFKVRS